MLLTAEMSPRWSQDAWTPFEANTVYDSRCKWLIVNIRGSHLQEVDQMFDVHVNTHPLVINSRHIDEHVVTNYFPVAV